MDVSAWTWKTTQGSLVIEVALFNESKPELISELNDWLLGSNGIVRYAFGILVKPESKGNCETVFITIFQAWVSDGENVCTNSFEIGNDSEALAFLEGDPKRLSTCTYCIPKTKSVDRSMKSR